MDPSPSASLTVTAVNDDDNDDNDDCCAAHSAKHLITPEAIQRLSATLRSSVVIVPHNSPDSPTLAGQVLCAGLCACLCAPARLCV